jgi:hypothetical protein
MKDLGNKMSRQFEKSAKCAHLAGSCFFAARKQFTTFGSVKVVLLGSTTLYSDWIDYLRSKVTGFQQHLAIKIFLVMHLISCSSSHESDELVSGSAFFSIY